MLCQDKLGFYIALYYIILFHPSIS